MNGRIYFEDGTSKAIKDTRTPEEKAQRRAAVLAAMERQRAMRDKTPEGRRYNDLIAKWEREDAEKKQRDAEREVERIKYRAERDKKDRWLWILIIFFPITIPIFVICSFIEAVREDGFAETVDSIFKALPYVLFPPLILLEIFSALYGE